MFVQQITRTRSCNMVICFLRWFNRGFRCFIHHRRPFRLQFRCSTNTLTEVFLSRNRLKPTCECQALLFHSRIQSKQNNLNFVDRFYRCVPQHPGSGDVFGQKISWAKCNAKIVPSKVKHNDPVVDFSKSDAPIGPNR